jgi:pimeloyl-ACP methyl ester carboxylesterase
LAAKLAANNSPKQLILEAPYYSFENLVGNIAPMVPSFLINYKIKTYEFLKHVTCPITIFQGKDDQLITPNDNAIPLSKIKSNITLYLINNCNHNGIYKTPYYYTKIQEVLQ